MNKFFCGAMIILLTWANAPAQAPEWIVYNRANSGLPDDAVYNFWELGMPSSHAEEIVIDQNNAK